MADSDDSDPVVEGSDPNAFVELLHEDDKTEAADEDEDAEDAEDAEGEEKEEGLLAKCFLRCSMNKLLLSAT